MTSHLDPAGFDVAADPVGGRPDVLHEVAVAAGDGIGPEIMDAVLAVLRAAGCPLRFVPVRIGQEAYRAGFADGLDPDAFAVFSRTGVLLKSPTQTPQGEGFKSVNVSLRAAFDLFANVRPVRSYAPVLAGPAGVDMVIVRENTEDVYIGQEYRRSADVAVALKQISVSGSRRIVQFAFEFARSRGRSTVDVMSKDNIMKLSDGVFHAAFDDLARSYPELAGAHHIVDIGIARVASRPAAFDVVVTENLYGDIVSDVAAEVTGSVGLAPSANIGMSHAMFEAIHGSAPDIAGRDMANPSGLLLAAVMMLEHLGLFAHAQVVSDAWCAALEAGARTADMAGEGAALSCSQFARTVIDHLGRRPETLPAYQPPAPVTPRVVPPPAVPPALAVGIAVGADASVVLPPGVDPTWLVGALSATARQAGMELVALANGGMTLWVSEMTSPVAVDKGSLGSLWRARLSGQQRSLVDVYGALSRAGFHVASFDVLYRFGDEPGFSSLATPRS